MNENLWFQDTCLDGNVKNNDNSNNVNKKIINLIYIVEYGPTVVIYTSYHISLTGPQKKVLFLFNQLETRALRVLVICLKHSA